MAIGSSLAAACLGLCEPDKSALEAYAQLMGLDPESDELYEKDYIKRGMFMEPAIIAWLCHEEKLTRKGSPGLLECPGIPWLVATPDDLAVDEQGRWVGIEVKKRDWSTKHLWTPEPPVDIQVQHDIALLCLGLDEGYLACDFGRGPLHIVRRVRNDQLLEPIIEALDKWRTEHMLANTPPAMTSCAGSERIWRALHPKDNGQTIDATPEIANTVVELDKAKAILSSTEKIEAGLKAEIVNFIGENTFLRLPDGSGYKFATQTTNYKATEARTTESRVLRRMKKL